MKSPLTPCSFRLLLIVFLSVSGALFPALSSYAKTTITFENPYGLTLPDAASWEHQFQSRCDDNGPAYADAFAFANTLGYAVGKSTLGTFPHFEAGVTMSAGLTNMKNFQHSKTGVYNGTVPGFGLSPCAHFGVGLGGGFDFLGKFMSFNQDIYKLPIPKNSAFNLDEFSQYSLGGKIRYNYVKEKTIIPFLLNFGGVTFSLGGDLMRGKVAGNGKYTFQFPTQSVTYSSLDFQVEPTFDGKYNFSVSWFQLSTTAQAVAYFDIMYLFSIYTGFGATVGYGWYVFSFDASGTLTDTSATPPPTGADLGTASFDSKSRYNPAVFIPTYIIGLECNIGFLKIVGESQVNLSNRSDVSASLGLRMQF